MNKNSEQGPLVSIIMNCYNSDAYLQEALNSVVNQTYANWELIFWDNQSTDASAFIVNAINDSRIRYHYAPVHTSLGEGRNKALDQVSGDLIAFLDCDDKWMADKLMKQVSYFNDHPDVGLVYCNFVKFGERIGKEKVAFSEPQPEGDVYKIFLRNYPINLQTVVIRRNLLIQHGLYFDPTLRVSEEFDLFMRLLLYTKAGYIHEPLAYYRLHNNMLSVRQIDVFPVEVEQVIKKLKEVDVLASEHETEYFFFEAKNAYYKLRSSAYRNQVGELRKVFLSAVKLDKKFFFLWVVTFLPRKVFTYFLKATGGYSNA